MYTAAALKSQTVRDLGKLAAKLGVEGWRSMRKDELVRALVRAAKRKAAKRPAAPKARSTSKTRTTTSKRKPNGVTKAKPKSPRVASRIRRANEERERQKNLAAVENGNGRKAAKPAKPAKPAKQEEVPTLDGKKDRIVLLVRDAYWLQAMWELTRPSVERAKAAMAEHWHTSRPVIRLIELEAGGMTSTAERVAREIEVHGGVRTWYIDVHNSPQTFRVDIGYLAANGKFFTLARSNTVTTPRPGNGDDLDQNWSEIAENCEKIYALSGGYSDDGPQELQEVFEERLGRPMGSQVGTRFGVGADKMLSQQRDFEFEVDAEMIIFGTTRPNAHITLAGTPIKLRPDGSFSARLSLPDRRQVLPIVASSPDGVEQRTVVLAVERNTKVMEPKIHEANQ